MLISWHIFIHIMFWSKLLPCLGGVVSGCVIDNLYFVFGDLTLGTMCVVLAWEKKIFKNENLRTGTHNIPTCHLLKETSLQLAFCILAYKILDGQFPALPVFTPRSLTSLFTVYKNQLFSFKARVLISFLRIWASNVLFLFLFSDLSFLFSRILKNFLTL